MQKALQIIDNIIYKLRLNKFEGIKPISTLSKRYNIHGKQILRMGVVFILALSLLTVFYFTDNIIFLCLSILYPTYSTARAIGNDDLAMKEGKLWLSYWACFGFLAVVNKTFGFILHYLPFYNVVRCLLLIWLYNRTTRGAEFVASHVFDHFLKKYGKHADENIEKAKEQMYSLRQKNE